MYNRIKKSVTNGAVTRTFFPGYYEEEVSGSTTTIIKHYSFNGQIIATRRKVGTNDVLRYTHTDHLGSSSGQTDANGYAVTYLHYHAYGTVHEGNPATLNTDRTFTGQKQDGTGLLYYNARYYDPTLGTFISPDTLVPDAGVLFDYNRYLYTRGNPLKYTDPSGHCAEEGRTSTVGSDAAQCWVMADTILAMWDSTDYWSNRYTSKEVFEQIAAIPSNDFAWMQQELQWFFESPEEQARRQRYREMANQNGPTNFDLGDYTSVGIQIGFVNPQLIFDDYGGVYFAVGLGGGIPGISLSRNDIAIDMVDIDRLNLSDEQKASAANQSLTGASRSISGGFLFVEFNFGWSAGTTPQYQTMGGGTSFSPGPSAWVNILSFSGRIR